MNVVFDPLAIPGAPHLGEYGWDGTAGTIFWIDPKDEMVTVLMTQSSPANPDSPRRRSGAGRGSAPTTLRSVGQIFERLLVSDVRRAGAWAL